MKIMTLIFVAAALLAVGVTQAFGTSSSARSMKTVTVAMHDPGCHWFAVGKTFKRTLTVTAPVKLLNVDEAALRIARAGHVVRAKVGASIVLRRGSYAITMVGQAPDDNHLKLAVK